MAIVGESKVIPWEYADSKERERRRKADERRFDTELGKLVRAWASLHEELAAQLFRPITRCEFNVGLAIWHTIRSDLTQREMLMAAAQTSSQMRNLIYSSSDQIENDRAFGAIKQLLDEINRFSHKRNNFVHAPIIMINNHSGEFEMTPWTWNNNPKSFSLLGKDLIQYCRYSVAFCTDAQRHVGSIARHLASRGPLPDKFVPRPIGQFQTRKQDNSRGKSKPRARPPRSSQG